MPTKADISAWKPIDDEDTSAWKPIEDTSPQPSQPGFFQNLGHAFGIGDGELASRLQQLKEHPVRTALEVAGGPAVQAVQAAESLYGGAKRSAGELSKAFQSAKEGNKAGAAVHAITAVPMVGPALNKMAEESPASEPGQSYASRVMADATPGNIGTALGTAAQVAPMALGALDTAAPERGLIAQIPSRARAGRTFESVMQSAKDQPVTLTRSMPFLERTQQLASRGAAPVRAADQLFQRVNTVNPLNYPEARDFASNLSGLSAAEKMAANPTMQRSVGQLSHAFNEDVGDAAAAAGRGEDYANAMKEYRRASQLRNAGGKIAKWAIPAAVGGGATGALLHKVLQ